MVEAVLPLRISGGYSQFDRERADILLQSLDKFWSGRERLVVWIVATNDALEVGRNLPTYERIEPRVVGERDLIREFADFPDAPGWYKQQLVKLAAHHIVDSEFYLVLDADNICAQQFCTDTLIVGGKALTDWEWKRTHAEWWQGSSEFLHSQVPLKGFGMSVTQEVLSGSICKQLLAHICELYKEHWCASSYLRTFANSTRNIGARH